MGKVTTCDQTTVHIHRHKFEHEYKMLFSYPEGGDSWKVEISPGEEEREALFAICWTGLEARLAISQRSKPSLQGAGVPT